MTPEQTKICQLKHQLRQLRQQLTGRKIKKYSLKFRNEPVDISPDPWSRAQVVTTAERQSDAALWAERHGYTVGHQFRFTHRDYLTAEWLVVPGGVQQVL